MLLGKAHGDDANDKIAFGRMNVEPSRPSSAYINRTDGQSSKRRSDESLESLMRQTMVFYRRDGDQIKSGYYYRAVVQDKSPSFGTIVRFARRGSDTSLDAESVKGFHAHTHQITF